MAEGIKGTIIAGVFAVAGAGAGAAFTRLSQVELAKQKFNSDLVIDALESGDATQRLQSPQRGHAGKAVPGLQSARGLCRSLVRQVGKVVSFSA
jgi:hypothetical protein